MGEYAIYFGVGQRWQRYRLRKRREANDDRRNSACRGSPAFAGMTPHSSPRRRPGPNCCYPFAHV
jgi:hypothetical protein